VTDAEVNALPLGLYYVQWASGGGSVATIGMNAEGYRWIAPSNWISGASIIDRHIREEMVAAQLLATQGDVCIRYGVPEADEERPPPDPEQTVNDAGTQVQH
jgi:hypothetical protein